MDSGSAIRRVLVVDDSRAQRRLVCSALLRLGFQVAEAGSGAEALAHCRDHPVDLIVSDWMMPGMDGLTFCRAFRALPRDSYGYFILLTSKSEKDEVARGLDAGADDFLAKPVDPGELRARVAAGERILGMERELTEKNRLIGTQLREIQTLYDSLDRDLIEARKLQQSLVRDRFRNFGAASVSLLLRPSGHVGGDLVGFFQIDRRRVGLYAVDVSGHGVTSAILTARIAGLFSAAAPDQNIALRRHGAGHRGRAPSEVADALNRLLLEEMHTDQYLTLLYAEADLATGRVALVQAGHPHPAVQRACGRVEFLGAGGLPVGLVPGARYHDVSVGLRPGDRLILMSDGITECPDPSGNQLGEPGIARLLGANHALSGPRLFDALMWDLHGFAGGADFRDDVSGVLWEYRGPRP
ncbi:PP2C family protein-serine/threonine phosphatase [Acidimangrovimonas sediminis]|uniref:PP2C family protein-serine/threonine phosphatase n=1 Tax=Acidimangrovimonas sediminis TaxID=2056283 RepID=UPI001E597B9A|nr:SpoIIE family protein phosphatase [Acidimangrovimonas sediminis]